MGTISIPSGWLRGIQDSLSLVETSGAAFAAIWAAKDFADSAAAAIREGGSWWSPDPWRTSAAKELEEAGVQITREEAPYKEGSSTAIDRGNWAKVAGKISNVYALARLSKDSFPQGEDVDAFDVSLIEGAALLGQAVLSAPKVAVDYVVDVADNAVEKVGDFAKKTVRKATEIVDEAAKGLSKAAGDLIPWRVLLGAGLVLAAATGAVVLLARSGAIKQIGGLRG